MGLLRFAQTGSWSVNETGGCTVLWSVDNSAHLYELKLELPFRTTATARSSGTSRAFAMRQCADAAKRALDRTKGARAFSAGGAGAESPRSVSGSVGGGAAAADDDQKGADAKSPKNEPAGAAGAGGAGAAAGAVLAGDGSDSGVALDESERTEELSRKLLRDFWTDTVWELYVNPLV